MDPQTLWIITLSIATPIAGIVGFAIQLREVRKGRLENEKLQLEIKALRTRAAAADSRIVQISTADVLRFANKDDSMFSRKGTEEISKWPTQKASLKEIVTGGAILLSLLLLTGYLLYDLYRLVAWASSKL